MSQFFKNKLFNNKVFNSDLPLTKIIPYTYDIEDLKNSIEYIPTIHVNTNMKISINKSVLKVENNTLDISNLLVGDVIKYLSTMGVTSNVIDISSVYTDSRGLCDLPAILLSDCSNLMVQKLDGLVSPLDLDLLLQPNRTIQTISEEQIINILLLNTSDNSNVNYQIVDNKLYFQPSASIVCIVSRYTSEFALNVDFTVKQLADGQSIGQVLSHAQLRK